MGAHKAVPLYAERLAELRGLVRSLEERSGRISTWRGLTFVGAAGLGAAAAFASGLGWAWVPAGVLAAAFVALVVFHAILVTRVSALEVRIKVLVRGEKRIAGTVADLPESGERFVVPRHAYAGDLDVFGRASLFQLVSAAETGPGEAKLAAWLSAPAGAAEIAARQEAVRELVGLARFREDLAALGAESGTKGRDADPMLAWAETRGDDISSGVVGAGALLVALTLGLLIAAEVLGGAALGPLRRVWLVPLVLQGALLLASRAKIEAILKVAASPEAPFGRYVALFRRIEAEELVAPRLRALKEKLTKPLASEQLRGLERVVGFAELRESGLVHILANILLVWDLFVAAALQRWRARSGREARRWIEALAEIEALVSLATFAAEHPGFAFPEVGEGELRFDAADLGHPLLAPGVRVTNDVSLGGSGAGLLVTGSNMSGKSTLLRAIGINAVLALAGAPVCASRLSISGCSVQTSMRIKDSLEEGVSHFYAELERLKGIVDLANGGERVLFLLDEVLHGTNSRERQIGAKAVVKHLLAKGATGAVSSHDLGLSDLEAESGGRVKNVHFQELVAEGKMTFDYKLKPGVVTSANALRLMKVIGIAVELPDE